MILGKAQRFLGIFILVLWVVCACTREEVLVVPKENSELVWSFFDRIGSVSTVKLLSEV